MLGSFPKEALEAWKKREGEENAKKIANQAARKGTSIHKLCENYLNNDEFFDAFLDSQNPFARNQFRLLVPHLERVDNVRGIELTLWSDKLKLAGTTDLIAEWDGELSIIDFKTSRKPKRKEWITDYFLQASIYSMMLFERTGLEAKKIVIMITVDHEPPQIFIEKTKDWVVPAINKNREFWRMKNND